ncbi:type II toxin-antitoxin system RelE/ParE family toxin [Agrobacterium vitis]|uniref:Toxin n=1 Tax=Agrobacterium vitis TaxID=373 RepID=A0ABD6GEK0_AGRVI|nr:type II toxin-antitoxin system RelE/ParE family toxin [Agrobacterium vitis]MUO77842.1 type II toxin-antitoxin system RelE/ParE family toxin [Agrobacterium vitis]MUO93360.1 type II toxin-antitoxin system RelE/ParE family toxin [Agrobacterium vitis]MUP04711.1 type II toxin-antitoxin system RelE/ParE family toxin [Agrobacterium vitis]MUZ80852.1 type II toxin-antitoxin system RelE/ParE family toxin [Agrobacterium vitis]MVA08963.1 type II toxin-antitoxin system RelE/ParE family toxin [Agrobacter
MSGKSYRVTEIARLDVEDLGRYTNKTWGKRQRNDYLRALFSRFEFLAEFPYSGQKHDNIREGLFGFSEGAHVIFYRINAEGIDILRVLHQRMSLEERL